MNFMCKELDCFETSCLQNSCKSCVVNICINQIPSLMLHVRTWSILKNRFSKIGAFQIYVKQEVGVKFIYSEKAT